MATIVILGAGIGGMSQAYELKQALGKTHRIVVVNDSDRFEFTPSNPWVAVGWRSEKQITVELPSLLAKHGIEFIGTGAQRVLPEENSIELGNGERLDYDYLVIATGPKLAFDEVPGLGPGGHTESICKTGHAAVANEAFSKFVENPGPVVIGAAQGASCYGPAYEYAFIVDTELRKRKIRDRVPMTFVTPEPYIGTLVSTASVIPRACWSRRCVSATSAGSPTPESMKSPGVRCESRKSTSPAMTRRARICPLPRQ